MVAKLDQVCEVGNRVFLIILDGAFRSSCGASGHASVRSLGFLEPPRRSAVWAVHGTMRLPCRGWVSWCGLGPFPGVWISPRWSSCQDQWGRLDRVGLLPIESGELRRFREEGESPIGFICGITGEQSLSEFFGFKFSERSWRADSD